MKHKLTQEQIENLYKYKELIDSNDKESIMLGASLFYEEYKDKLCPTENLDYYNCLIEFDFRKLNPSFLCFHDIVAGVYIRYWRYSIDDLLVCGYYKI